MCVPNEGTTPEKIGMAQAQRSKAAEEPNARIHMALMFSGMGTRALPEGYGRVTTWADMEDLLPLKTGEQTREDGKLAKPILKMLQNAVT